MTTHRRTKLSFALLALVTFFATSTFAQDSTKHTNTLYTVIINQVPENFKGPLIGVVNIADGNQNNLQVGFTNLNQKSLGGTQIGFVNAVGGGCIGAQVGYINACRDSLTGAQVGFINGTTNHVNGAEVGFVNICRDSLTGAQVGFVNLVGKHTDGAQVGFVNANKDSLKGAQVGFVNLVGKHTDGTQVGFVNANKDSLNGAQVGFVNVSGKTIDGTQVGFVNANLDSLSGAQVGFVNLSLKKVNGAQIGFVNIADSINGIPVGFLSFVRKGGIKTFELSYTDMYPVSLSFKTGVKQLYTSFSVAYNPDFKEQFAYGFGLGSMLNISRSVFFNPEATAQVSFQKEPQQITSLSTLFGYSFSDHWSIVAGPSVTWTRKDKENTDELFKPSFSIHEWNIDNQNRIHIGARAALRFTF